MLSATAASWRRDLASLALATFQGLGSIRDFDLGLDQIGDHVRGQGIQLPNSSVPNLILYAAALASFSLTKFGGGR